MRAPKKWALHSSPWLPTPSTERDRRRRTATGGSESRAKMSSACRQHRGASFD